jgi:DNA-binding HxlR family transcriptional regulator
MQVCCTESTCSGEDCIQLADREMLVCGIICGSSDPVRFSKIKQHTGLHQTVVTRIIHTLEAHKVIEKVDGRYRKAGSQ